MVEEDLRVSVPLREKQPIMALPSLRELFSNQSLSLLKCSTKKQNNIPKQAERYSFTPSGCYFFT
jgi:hypothetical protein